MTNEEKQLLLKDLCAMLPYGVVMQMNNHNYLPTKLKAVDIETQLLEIGTIHDVPITRCKPYLRPMESMDEKEKAFYAILIQTISTTQDMACLPKRCEYMFRWLRSNHFDYMGLIPKGLAIEAPEGMYKTE